MFNNTYACQVEPAVKSDSWSCCHTSTTCAVTHCGATATSSCLKFLCLVQMVKTGAVKDDAQGENILGKISNLRPHPTHLLLANLKAEQEMNLNRPHEVLKTVRPFLSSSERCCWALNKALWAHWVTGNLPEVRLPTWCLSHQHTVYNAAMIMCKVQGVCVDDMCLQLRNKQNSTPCCHHHFLQRQSLCLVFTVYVGKLFITRLVACAMLIALHIKSISKCYFTPEQSMH